MCGRFTLEHPEQIPERFHTVNGLPEVRPSWNVTPGQTVPIVTNQGRYQVELMKWGFVPSRSDDPRIGYRMINARAETVAEKPAYRSAFKSRRCLIPASGYYEWQEVNRTKTPYYFRLRDEELFSIAGLYETWRDPAGQELATFTLITTTPNEKAAVVHNRMPAILTREAEAQWLDPQNATPETLSSLLSPIPSELLEARKVSLAVNNPGNDSPELLHAAG